MAWDWLKDNNDEPNEFKPIDARGLLDGKEYHDYWTTKLHNGLANVPKSLLGAVESIPAMAARTRPAVMQELENDLEGTGLMDSDADKEALSDVESQIKGTTAPIWEGARLGVKAAKDALPDANWESNVDESQLSYPKKIGGMILENAPLMAAQLGASIINPALGVALMAGSIAGDAYNDLTEKGVDPLTAGQAGWLDAAAQAPLEGVGEMGWLKAFRELGTEGAAKLMGKAFVKEGLTEAVQEFPDETIPYIAEHGSLDGFDWGQLASNAVDAGVVGGIYGGGFAGIGRAINGKAQPDEAQADNGDTPSPSPAMHAMNRLVNELGIDPKAASGIVGGLMLESGGNTTDISPTAENPTSGSYGIGQWLGSRKDELMAFAEETGGDPNDLDTQISFLIHELKGSENGALQEILKAQSPDEAGRLADQFYERSEGTDEIRNQKAANAQKIYDIFMNGGADPNVVYNGGKRGGSSVPNPKSAEDFLKDLEETLPADTDEDVEKLNAVRKAIQDKNKKAQEELAAQYGWSANSPETAQNASEPVTQGNTQSATDNAATGQMTQSVTYPMAIPQGRGNSISGTKPIKFGGGMYQPSGRVEGGNKSVYTPKKPKGMQYTPQGNVQAGSNEGGMTAVRPNVSPVIPAPNSIKEPASNASTSLPSTEPQIYTPRKVNGIADRQRRDRQTRGNMASAVTQDRINKALKNSRLRQVVKQAFVDGDKDALNRLGAMQINQDVLQAVKNDVMNEYHKTEPVVPPKVIPAQEPYTPRYSNRDEAMRLPRERDAENAREDVAIGGGNGVIAPRVAKTPSEAMRLTNAAREQRADNANKDYDIGKAPSRRAQKKAAIAQKKQEKRDAENTNVRKYEPKPYTSRYDNREDLNRGMRDVYGNKSGDRAHKGQTSGVSSTGKNERAESQNRVDSRDDMSGYVRPGAPSIVATPKDRKSIESDMRNRQQNRNKYESDNSKNGFEKPSIPTKENNHENTEKNQPVHHPEENKNDNAKPEQSKPSESKDRKTPESKNPVKNAPSKETQSGRKKEALPKAKEEPKKGEPTKPEAQDTESATPKEKEPSAPKETVFGSVEDADKDLEATFGLKPVADTEQEAKKAEEAKPPKEEIHRKHKLVDDSDEAIQGYIDEFIRKTRNLNAGFDPTILVPVFKICAAYTQRGITKFADFASKTIAAFKAKGVKQKDIEPWLAPAWEAVKSFPDTGKKFDAKKLVVALKAVGARYESGLKTADAVKDDIRSKYGDKAVSTLNDYIDASFRGVQAYFGDGENANPEPPKAGDKTGADLIDYAFNQGGIINEEAVKNLTPSQADAVLKIFNKPDDSAVDNSDGNGTMKKDNSKGVPAKEKDDVRGREQGSSRPVEVGGPGKSGTSGKGEQRTARGNSETPDRDGGRKRGPDAESAEPKNKGTGGSRELGRGQAEDGTRMERTNGEGTSAGGTKKPVISPKADKVETDIAKGKVKDARDVPGNDYIAKPVPPDAKGASKTQRVDNNIAAIKLLKKIESENRMATPAEQEILAGYSGWGGLGSEMKSDTKRMAQLKELLTEEEYNAAERELLTAFYTPPFVISRMWELAEHLGFKGGRVLDPSCGVGSFFSLMPASLRERSTALQGVELSPIPARIAKQLYQSKKFKIDNQDYTKFDRGNGFYDLAITNVPFSNSVKAPVPAMRDSDGGVHKSLLIHDYYFAQTLDKVRPGGLIVFMTSSGTMDRKAGYDNALLRHLSSRAKLVGIVRLPNTLFAPSANVGTDIVVFRKLNEGENPDTVDTTNGWTNGLTTIEAKDDEGRHTYTRINGYYEDNPENIIGDPVLVRDRYGSKNVEFHTSSNAETDKKLGEAIARLPENVYVPREPVKINTPSHVKELVDAEDGQNVGDIIKGKDGQWGQVVIDDNGERKLKPFAKSAQAKVGTLKELSDSLNDVLAKQVDPDVSEAALSKAREKLNKQYDSFVRKYGYINDKTNVRQISGSPIAGRLLALEQKYKAGTKGKESTAEKAPILTERTAYPATDDLNISTTSDALASSLRKFGFADIKYMASVLGKSENAIIKELGDKLFKDPVSEQYVPRDEYLSGNVRQKLAFAEDAARSEPEYARNVEALKAVIPADIEVEDIEIPLGSPILSVEDTQAFIDDLLGEPNAVVVRYNPVTTYWEVTTTPRYGRISAQAHEKYEIARVSYDDRDNVGINTVISKILNTGKIESSNFKVKDDDSETVRKARAAAEVKAQTIVKDINEKLKEWILKTPEVKQRVGQSYNNKFNAVVPRHYDGSLLTFPWLNAAANMTPRVHQADAVWRTINEKSVLYAHCVGSGKTLTMQAAGLELRRMGLANKIVYCVPKNVVRQFEREFYQVCPSAKILVLDSSTLPDNITSIHYDVKPKMELREDRNGKKKLVAVKDADGVPIFEKVKVSDEEAKKREVRLAKRNAALNQILTHDWDAIIMSHETFQRLPMSDEYMMQFRTEELEKYKRALAEEQAEERQAGKKSKSLKNIQEKIAKLEGKLNALIAKKQAKDFESPSLEDLGIDQLFVDEADTFKNLEVMTKYGQVKGISESAADRSFDMLMKTRYLLHSPNAHGVVFATGTPISNSVVELYTMCRYLNDDSLKRLGVDSFDQFAKMFIDIGQTEVPAQDGSGYEYKTAVRGLRNAPECINLFKEFADVKMVEDLPYIAAARPKAKRVAVAIEESAWNKRFKKDIRARVAAIKSSGRKDPPMINSKSKESKAHFAKTGEYLQVADSPLLVANDLKKASLAPFTVDDSLTGVEGYGKIWACADKIYEEWKDSSDRHGAQLVFCDQSIPDRSSNDPNAYDALKSRLIELGIPESDIAFVQDAKTDKAQAALFEAVNEGRVRVLIGSTQKMGAGTNMQHKLVALHHLDCPWRPRDIEQREGRILRQGNENKEVRIYNYVTKGTYDENLWDTVNTKKNVINQLMIGDKGTRNADTSDVDGDNYEALIELANADPDTKRYRQVMSQLTELESAKTTFEKSQELSKRVLVTAPELIDKFKTAIESVKDDMATLEKTSSAKFSMKIGQAVYENKIEANKAFSKEKEHVAKEFAKIAHKYGVDNAKFKDVKIASARGLDIYVSGNNPSFKAGFASEALTVYAKGKDSYGAATPTAIGVWNAMQTQPAAKLKGYETELKKNESELAEAKESQGDTFKDDEKIKSLREEQEELRKKIEEKAKRQRELDSIEPTPITLYESTSFGSYDLDVDDPDVYDIENNIRDGLVLSMRENNTDTGTVSFDKPGSWDKFKKKFIDKTNWAVYSNENTIEITASQKDLNDLYEAIESQEETKYSLSQGGKRISLEEMTKQTLSVFPNAQNIETHDNSVSFDLPNGSHVEVNFTDDTIAVDRAKAQKDYGGTLQGNEKASGKIEMVDKDALITLTMDSPDETISHEAMHLAWNLLTDRERTALLRTYGSEEGAAEGMREWKIRRKMKQGTIAGKIMQKISDMAHKLLSLFHENDQHVFQKLESGEMWERSNENNTAARNVKYKMNPLNEAEKYLKSHKDLGEKAGVYIDRTFRPDLAKAKANPNISVNETAKKNGWGVANTALNNTVRSPSRIKSPKTNYIWGLADTAQRELQELRGRWTHNFAGAIKNLNKEEKARYTDILWEEDMKQHVFSDEELRDAGVSENVIKAHQKTRNLLGKIYNAVNAVYTSERVENFTYKTRKGAEKAQKELAKRPHTFVMHDIRETTKDGETAFQVSIKTRGYKEIHSVMTSEELSALSKDKDVYIKARNQMDDGSFKVSYLAYNKPLTNMEGYMPHIFHGVLIMKKYTDVDGNVKSKVVGSADTIEKAVVKADAMQKEEGGEFIIAPKEFSSEGEVENPLLLGDMDYFKLMESLSKGASLTLDEAREMTHATMKGRHVYYGAKRHRKGAEGFEKNAIWAIQHHIDSSSRYVALDPFKQKAISFFERAFGDYNKDWTGEAAFCKGYIDSVLGKPSRLETLANDFLRLFPWFKNEARPARRMAGNLTGLTGVLKLGASLSSGFVNTLQLFNCVGYVGARKTAVGLKRALHPNATDKKILVASGVSEESGLALDSIGHITAEGTALSKAGNVINSVNNFLMKPFTFAEKTIRKATILAAYYKAIGDGLSKGEAIQYARDINRKVNFDYSVADAPRIFRALQGTVIGDMALQFQKYGIKEMEVISDFLPILGNTTTKQKLEFFIPYLLVSGIWNAFPFEDALLSLLKLLGFDDPEKEAKRAMMEWAGNNAGRKALVNVANYGAGAIVGVDISQRVGLKGVVPETSNIVTGGPLGSTTVQLAKAVLNRDANGAMKAVSPALGNVYGAVAGYNTDSKGRKTVDYDTRDRIVRGLGFRTVKEANATDAQGIVYNYKEQKKNDRAKAKSEYLKDPSSSNRQKLKEMGYSDKEIKALKDDKKSTRVERSQSGLSKEDKKKLKPVFDYVQ